MILLLIFHQLVTSALEPSPLVEGSGGQEAEMEMFQMFLPWVSLLLSVEISASICDLALPWAVPSLWLPFHGLFPVPWAGAWAGLCALQRLTLPCRG